MVKVYAVNCEALCHEARLRQVLPRLDAGRRGRVARLRLPQKRAQCAAAGILLRHLFGDVAIACTQTGKPYLPASPDTYFSLSHTGNFVVCAVAEAPVGIDAQQLTACNGRLAKRWFTPAEQEWIRANPDERFTRLWTQREAYAKMTGEGIIGAIGSGVIPHHTVECTELIPHGVYVAVCLAGNAGFSPVIEILKEPLW